MLWFGVPILLLVLAVPVYWGMSKITASAHHRWLAAVVLISPAVWWAGLSVWPIADRLAAETAAILLVALVIAFFVIAGSVQNLDRPRVAAVRPTSTPLWLRLTLAGVSLALAYGYYRILVRS